MLKAWVEKGDNMKKWMGHVTLKRESKGNARTQKQSQKWRMNFVGP